MKKLLNILSAPIKLQFQGAGLICFMIGPWALHFFVTKQHWVFGYQEDWYDGPLPCYGFGPVFLLCGLDADTWCYHCDDYTCIDRERHGY